MNIEEEITQALSKNWRNMHTNESLGQQRMLAAALMPLVRRAQAEGWERGAKDVMRAVAEEQTVSFVAPHNPYIEQNSEGNGSE